MQFPVPQFTDVEDRIIGNLTFRQFGILLGTGGLIFFSYSVSKSILVTAFFGLVFGLPALVLAFGQFNGRPMYRSIPIFLGQFTNTKAMVFRKQSTSMHTTMTVKNVEVAKEQKPETEEDARTRLKKIQYQLEARAKEQEEILGKR